MGDTPGLEKADDNFVLPVTGQLVTQLRIDYAITLLTENDVQIRIEGPFVFQTPEGDRLEIDPEGDPTLLAPLLRLARSRIERGLASEDGRLELHFGEGQILVPSLTNFEP